MVSCLQLLVLGVLHLNHLASVLGFTFTRGSRMHPGRGQAPQTEHSMPPANPSSRGEVTWTHFHSLEPTWMHLDRLGCNRNHVDYRGCSWTHPMLLVGGNSAMHHHDQWSAASELQSNHDSVGRHGSERTSRYCQILLRIQVGAALADVTASNPQTPWEALYIVDLCFVVST